jgi:putative chitinase
MQKVLKRFILEFIKLSNFLNKKSKSFIFIEEEKQYHPTSEVLFDIITKKEINMNLDKLKGIITDEVLSQIPQTMEKFAINTPLRLAHFLAQCGHESGNWKFKVENLNYSAPALQSVFRKYFPDEATAAQYARKPEMIANKVYANRMANGDEASGDGWRFRGRGYIQLTGRQNYTSFDKVVNDDIITNPDLVAEKYPLLSAAWFWDNNKLNGLADKGATDGDVTTITKRVNGGTHGLDDRLSKFKQYYSLLV